MVPLRQAGDNLCQQVAQSGAFIEAVKYPTALRIANYQTGIGQQLQMARDARLALQQHLRQFRYRQFAQRQNRQNAKRVSSPAARKADEEFPSLSYIKISLYVSAKPIGVVNGALTWARIGLNCRQIRE